MTDTFVFSHNKYVIDKDPDAVLDYTFDWTSWLVLDGLVQDRIVSKVLTVAPDAGAIVVNTSVIVDSVSNPTLLDAMVTVFVRGGRIGVKEPLACKITTLAGRVDERTVYLKILER